MALRIIFLVALSSLATCQYNIGDTCTDHTNARGRCKLMQRCPVAKLELQNGFRPTICESQKFGTSLVCCREGTSIPEKIIETNRFGNGRKSISERKCDEYSRDVMEVIDYIPLLPNPDIHTLSSAKCDYSGVELIVGGQDTDQGEFPHMAALGWEKPDGEPGYNFDCGGSLISERFILTAAHCQRSAKLTGDGKPVVARLADQNIDPSVNDGAQHIDVRIKRFIAHPAYIPPYTYNDIALLQLEHAVTFRADLRPACLWKRPDFGTHNKAVATGWGVIDPNRPTVTSKELQKVSLSLLQNDYCAPLLSFVQNRLWWGFGDTQLCAGELRDAKDTCQGDSGAPLQVVSKENHCIFHIVGITSFGRKCAEIGKPAIYTRVSEYLPWIESIVWPGEE